MFDLKKRNDQPLKRLKRLEKANKTLPTERSNS